MARTRKTARRLTRFSALLASTVFAAGLPATAHGAVIIPASGQGAQPATRQALAPALQNEAANSPGIASKTPFLISADEVSYANDGGIEAAGHVEITSRYGTVHADKVVYNPKTKELTASGHVVYLTQQHIATYADKVTLDGALRQGTLETLRMRLMTDGPALTATSAQKTSDTTYVLHNVRYTSCKTDQNPMPWDLRARKVLVNTEKENITYHDVWLDVYGKPIVYLPYFKNSTNPKKPSNGLFPPILGHSTTRGDEITEGVYYRLDDQHDASLRVHAMSARGIQLLGQARFEQDHLSGRWDGSYLNDRLTGTVRGHLEGSSEYVFNPGERIGVNAQLASDDAYYSEFLRRDINYLTSTAYAEKADPNTYMAFSSTRYDDLRVGSDDSDTLQPLAHGQFEKTFDLAGPKNILTLSSRVDSLDRDQGSDTQRLINSAVWQRSDTLDDGSLVDFSANMRADLYDVTAQTDGSSYWVGRLLPQVSVRWQKPLVSPGGHHIVTPQAMLVVAPRGGNSSNIPNNDSVNYELDMANLFEANRFSGYDRVETGTRFVYGIDNTWVSGTSRKFSLFLGQSVRPYDDQNLPEDGGAATKFSDWVGEVSAQPLDNLTLNSRFRLDNSNFNPHRVDASATLGRIDKSYLQTSYSYLDNGPAELDANTRLFVNEQWYLRGDLRDSLGTNGGLLHAGVGVGVHHCCYNIEVSVERVGYELPNVPPSTEFLLNLQLLPMGSIKQPDKLFNTPGE